MIRRLAPERYKVQFTASAETFEKLRRAQDLMRHSVPDGDVAVIVDRALTLLLEHLDKTKLAAARRPRTPRGTVQGSRTIPAAVRRQVSTRDQGRCGFVGTHGRCTERGFLEFHHVVPFAAGGEATADNIELRCRAHNQYEADQYFGGQAPPIVRERPERLSWITTRSGPS
jgi:5-methylcytosine-specific restriction endonuclease McrA